MMCDEAMNRSAGRALGDLEPDEARGLEAHLATCASCRAGAELDRRTVAALKSDSVDASEGRRERVVAAMVAARRGKAETRIPRRRWIAVSVAAALLLALTVPLMMTRGGLSVHRLDGAAWIQRAGAGEYVALRIGDRLGAGDWLKTDSVVGLEGSGGLKIIVNRNSRIGYDSAGPTPEFRLAEGAVLIEAQVHGAVVVDASDRRATVRDGRFEIRTTRVASGSGEKKSELRVQVEKGVARVSGSGGVRDVGAGEAVQVDGGGRVSESEPGPFAPWRKQP